jgi:hypothetical protein
MHTCEKKSAFNVLFITKEKQTMTVSSTWLWKYQSCGFNGHFKSMYWWENNMCLEYSYDQNQRVETKF